MKDILEQMVGKVFGFYGVDNHMFKLGGAVLEAKEDESDGYRSYLKSIKVVKGPPPIFFKTPIAKVKVKRVPPPKTFTNYDEELEGYHLVDVKDGHVWLKVGTNYADSYYPFFVFEYTPKRGHSQT